MHDSLFADQGHQDVPHLWRRAEELGMDVEQFDRDRQSSAVAERVERDFRSGIRAGVMSTPTLFFDGRALSGFGDSQLAELLG
jgi:predicted DsbA family dithiol-disulfide isomerase